MMDSGDKSKLILIQNQNLVNLIIFGIKIVNRLYYKEINQLIDMVIFMFSLINYTKTKTKFSLIVVLFLISLLNTINLKSQSVDNNNKLHNISLFVGTSYNKVGDLKGENIKVSTGLDYEFKVPGVNNFGIGVSGMASFIGDMDIFANVPIYVYSNNQRFKIFFAPGIAIYNGIAPKINYLPNQQFPDEEKQLTAISYRIGMGYEFYVKKINIAPKLSFDFYDKYANLTFGLNVGYKL